MGANGHSAMLMTRSLSLSRASGFGFRCWLLVARVWRRQAQVAFVLQLANLSPRVSDLRLATRHSRAASKHSQLTCRPSTQHSTANSEQRTWNSELRAANIRAATRKRATLALASAPESPKPKAQSKRARARTRVQIRVQIEHSTANSLTLFGQIFSSQQVYMTASKSNMDAFGPQLARKSLPKLALD